MVAIQKKKGKFLSLLCKPQNGLGSTDALFHERAVLYFKINFTFSKAGGER